MNKTLKEWLANRALMLLVVVCIIGPSVIAMSGCAIPVAIPVRANNYYQQQPYYGGAQIPLGPSPIVPLLQRNQWQNQNRGYYGGGYYPVVPRVGFNIQLNIQGGNGGGYYHGGRY